MRIKRKLAFFSLAFISLLIFSLYGPWDFAGAYNKYKAADAWLKDGMSVTVQGQIYRKEVKNQQAVYYLKNAIINFDEGSLNNTSVILYLNSDNIPNYSKIKADGQVEVFKTASNEGGFDAKAYYNSLGLVCKITGQEANTIQTKGLAKYDLLYRLSKNLSELYEACLPGEEAGFLASIALGDKSGLNGDLKTLFQEAGLAHVLAVSGLHVSVVCMGLYSFLRKRGISFLTSGVTSGVIALLYGALTGFSVSAVRAVGTFIIYLLAQILGEAYDMLTSLALVAILLLLQNPLYLKNSSFIFSFSAVLGVIFFAKPMANLFDEYCKKQQEEKIKIIGLQESHKKGRLQIIKEKVLSNLVFSGMLTAATIPLVGQLFYQVPIYATFLNLFVLPLMPYLLGLGLIGGFCGLVYFPACQLILGICHYIIYLYEMLASLFTSLPFATFITGHHSMVKIVLYYMLLLAIVHGLPSIVLKLRTLKLGKVIVLQFALIICCSFIYLQPEKTGFEIDVLDVGQGDGIFISTAEGLHVFIDGGSTSSSQVGKYTILPFLKYKGVGYIDYWFISHTDEDHISGLIELINMDYDIKNIVVSAKMPDSDNWQSIKTLAKERQINICYMNKGDKVTSQTTELTCLFPDNDYFSEDVNSMCLCLLIKYDADKDGEEDFTGFFGGDVAAEEEELISENNSIEDIDFLKVSHHGSKYSSADSFISSLNPKIAAISCSKTNRYGHPAKEAVERIEKYGCQIYYTMESGRIKITENEVDCYK